MKTLVNDIKETIKQRLNDYYGASVYGCELGMTLFERENADGSVLCSTYATKEFIKDNFDFCGEVVEYWKDNIGELLNPFCEPEKFHVILLIESARAILNESETVNEFWNEETVLTDELIERICNDLENIDSINL